MGNLMGKIMATLKDPIFCEWEHLTAGSGHGMAGICTAATAYHGQLMQM
jgi:hypothetical protein